MPKSWQVLFVKSPMIFAWPVQQKTRIERKNKEKTSGDLGPQKYNAFDIA